MFLPQESLNGDMKEMIRFTYELKCFKDALDIKVFISVFKYYAGIKFTLIIDINTIESSDKVIFGTTVTVYNSELEKSMQYKIVGEDEADASKGKISFASPLARRLIGKFEGDILQVETPSGLTEYEIEKVEYL